MINVRALTLYVVRHGECEHNAEGRFASHDDSPLTANGRAQARANGRLLRALAGDPAALDFHASSLHRTCCTMELLREAAGLPATGYRADHRLMEMHAGDHIWTLRSALTPEDDRRFGADPWNYRRERGESQAMVHERVGRFLAGLTRDSVIVSHAVPVRMLRAHYLGLSPEDAVRYEHPNAGLLRLSHGAEAYFGE
ncbi:MAG: histidine phosphatase family protein [Rhizomicrobium sp.]